MHKVPEHLQSVKEYYPTQKAAKEAYKKSLTPEKKAEIRKKRAAEKAQDKAHLQKVKKSQSTMARRQKENKKQKNLTFPGYSK